MKKMLFLVAALVLISWGQASADYTYNFSYGSNDSTVAITGHLITPLEGVGPWTVTGGDFTGTFNNTAVAATLVANPTPGSVSTSPLGAFYYDNLLSPGPDPQLTYSGLLFHTGGTTDMEINIYGNNTQDASNYTYMQFSGSTSYSSDLRGTFTLTGGTDDDLGTTAVPEPVSLLFLGFGLVGIVGAKRKLKK